MRSISELRRIIEPAIAAIGFELVGCETQRQRNKMTVRVYIDSENGVTLDDCARVSRQISSVLEVEDPLMGPYDLEVSSPGLDRPLFTLSHFQRFVGRKITLRLRAPIDNQRNFKGVITAVEGEEIFLKTDEKLELKIDFEEIEKANLVPDLR